MVPSGTILVGFVGQRLFHRSRLNLACLLGGYSPSFSENLGFLAFITPT